MFAVPNFSLEALKTQIILELLCEKFIKTVNFFHPAVIVLIISESFARLRIIPFWAYETPSPNLCHKY